MCYKYSDQVCPKDSPDVADCHDCSQAKMVESVFSTRFDGTADNLAFIATGESHD